MLLLNRDKFYLIMATFDLQAKEASRNALNRPYHLYTCLLHLLFLWILQVFDKYLF